MISLQLAQEEIGVRSAKENECDLVIFQFADSIQSMSSYWITIFILVILLQYVH